MVSRDNRCRWRSDANVASHRRRYAIGVTSRPSAAVGVQLQLPRHWRSRSRPAPLSKMLTYRAVGFRGGTVERRLCVVGRLSVANGATVFGTSSTMLVMPKRNRWRKGNSTTIVKPLVAELLPAGSLAVTVNLCACRRLTRNGDAAWLHAPPAFSR